MAPQNRTHRRETNPAPTASVAQAILATRQTAVRGIISTGFTLYQLSQREKQTWKETANKEFGIHPYDAVRYARIGKAWGHRLDTPEFNRLKLPDSLEKLDWIARLPSEGLHEFLEEFDCSASSRDEVIKAVKSRMAKVNALKIVERTKTNLAAAVKGASSEVRAEIADAFRDWAPEMEEILRGGDSAENPDAEVGDDDSRDAADDEADADDEDDEDVDDEDVDDEDPDDADDDDDE
jgi:hypothetical protein